MSEIIISTLNARYIHASLGARYLYANMAELQAVTDIQEFIINTRPIDIAEKLLACKPKIIGLGVYIWNVPQTTELTALIKAISPETIIVLGGPEISYETAEQKITEYADYVITGQADLAFSQLCRQIIKGDKPAAKIIQAEPPKLSDIRLPYSTLTQEDIDNRVIYVEASRGCPFKCEFCLSSLDKTAIPFDLELFLTELSHLYDRGVRQFKFVDRTFNLKIENSIKILNFFLDRLDKDLFLHFELIPDHLPEKLKQIIQKFPAGRLQFEIGIQSFDSVIQKNISRKQDNSKSEQNISWLVNETTAHLHTDLIVGLPGETLETFGRGFDQLVKLRPHEIQVGILKRLRGTPIIRHTFDYQMKYNPIAPYNILSNKDISFANMQRMNRFARYWDLIANSGRFKNSLPVLLGSTPYQCFMQLSDWLFNSTDQTHKISLNRLFTLLFDAMTCCLRLPQEQVISVLTEDFNRSGLKGRPTFNLPALLQENTTGSPSHSKRQSRHK
ncbi:MAG: B12-binding domain-containing radical SAM protein [Gammaproteobacteria bacterium]|nr:B12-binding domain-containing radical SAM protein [Gammaproteobacteria bacterium]